MWRERITSSSKCGTRASVFVSTPSSMSVRAANTSHAPHLVPCVVEEANQDLCRATENMVQSVFDGCRVCLLSYGQVDEQSRAPMEEKNGRDDRSTLSSLLFHVCEKLRLLIRSNKGCAQIFERVENLKSTGWHYMLSTSLLEVNHDRVTDLLDKRFEKDEAAIPTGVENVSHTHIEGLARRHRRNAEL